MDRGNRRSIGRPLARPQDDTAFWIAAAVLSSGGTKRENVVALPARVRERLHGLGMDISGDGPAAFAEFMRSETREWAGIVRAPGAKVE